MFKGITDGKAVFEVVVDVDKIDLLIDLGLKARGEQPRIASWDGRLLPHVIITDDEWDELERLGANVPVRSHRRLTRENIP
jgi:hypothetical protein